MANGNGHSPNGMASAAVSFEPRLETSPFTIGGKTIEVPLLRLWDIKRQRARMDSIVANMNWLDYSEVILRIVAVQLAPDEPDDASATFAALMRACSMDEMRGLDAAYSALLRKSGFILGEAAAAQEAASPGTGTSTESPPTSQLEEFAAETPSESSKP